MTFIHPIGVALVMPPGPLRDAVLYTLRAMEAHVAMDHGDPANWSGLAAALEPSGAELLLFDLGCMDEPDLGKSIGEIKSRMPQLKIIAAYPHHDPAMSLLAMRVGADEFVHSPVGPALAAVFKRAIESLPRTLSPRGTVISVESANWGGGAMNLEPGAVFVLPIPTKLLPGDSRIEKLLRVIEFLRGQHDWVVLDFGSTANPLWPAIDEHHRIAARP